MNPNANANANLLLFMNHLSWQIWSVQGNLSKGVLTTNLLENREFQFVYVHCAGLLWIIWKSTGFRKIDKITGISSPTMSLLTTNYFYRSRRAENTSDFAYFPDNLLLTENMICCLLSNTLVEKDNFIWFFCIFVIFSSHGQLFWGTSFMLLGWNKEKLILKLLSSAF